MLTHVRVTRAFQQRCCFFAVTSVTPEVKNESRKEDFFEERGSKKRVFPCSSIDFMGVKTLKY